MKKLTFFAIATALVLGMSQCKKEQNPNQPADSGEKVTITLDVNGGKAVRGEKVNVTFGENTASVAFEQDDVIHVGSGGRYVGTLKYDANRVQFVGLISDPTPGCPLYFYFLGNKALSRLSDTVYTVDISDQSTELPVISMAASTDGNGNIVNYTDGNANYTARLDNKAALVKFTLTEGTANPVRVNGLMSGVRIAFSNNEILPDGNSGAITLYSKSDTEKWAILVPQKAAKGALASINGVYYECNVEATSESQYITTNTIDNTGQGVTGHFFTVGPNGHVVRFSPGNLQATTTDYGQTWTWKFADHQYDIIGHSGANGLVNGFGTISEASGTIDHFKWSAEGRSFGIEVDTNYFDGNFVDWGTNAIEGYSANEWRTMSRQEWVYLLEKRADAASKSGLARITGVQVVVDNGSTRNFVRGLVLLPDNWVLPDGCNFTPGGNEIGTYEQSFTTEQWSLMEQNGAVFLPRAGRISWQGGTGEHYVNAVNAYGDYWTSSRTRPNHFYYIRMKDSTTSDTDYYKLNLEHSGRWGIAVRLVR